MNTESNILEATSIWPWHATDVLGIARRPQGTPAHQGHQVAASDVYVSFTISFFQDRRLSLSRTKTRPHARTARPARWYVCTVASCEHSIIDRWSKKGAWGGGETDSMETIGLISSSDWRHKQSDRQTDVGNRDIQTDGWTTRRD